MLCFNLWECAKIAWKLKSLEKARNKRNKNVERNKLEIEEKKNDEIVNKINDKRNSSYLQMKIIQSYTQTIDKNFVTTTTNTTGENI